MQSKATTAAQYMDALPPERRAAMQAVRAMILDSVDSDIEETMSYGMLGYVVPHRVFPQGYHCDPSQPVPYICLASQKAHMSLYLMFAYANGDQERALRDGFAKAGKKVDMGKSCLRFKRLEDLDLNVLRDVIRQTPSADHVAAYVKSVGPDAWKKSSGKKPATKKVAAKKVAAKKSATKKAAKTVVKNASTRAAR
ncbi:MAG TPA: DUF1801 domain-containing protein [Gemmatimonas sp.]|nr:DUF1801 domain-containing protein [Gemmatimonas sp.]